MHTGLHFEANNHGTQSIIQIIKFVRGHIAGCHMAESQQSATWQNGVGWRHFEATFNHYSA